MRFIFPGIVMLLLGGMCALFALCVMGMDDNNILYGAPLAVSLVALTWLSHDIVMLTGRKSSFARALLIWSFSGRNRRRLGPLGALICMVQLWSLVYIVPALICWAASSYWNDFFPPWTFGQCFGSSFGMEMMLSLFLDLPSGFVGITERALGKHHPPTE